MNSSFTWLDYSERDRRRMVDVIEALQETEARDELGIGGVRNAMADKLFPGTSMLQTRVRYFLFVPWIYRRLEERRLSPSRMALAARQSEVKLIHALLHGRESRGVIGRRKKENLQRMPSGIYWGGLGAWGIWRYQQSQETYHRSAGTEHGRVERDENGEPILGGNQGNWHTGLPPEPEDLLESTTFSLRSEEARYLRERVLTSVPRTLLAYLLGRDRLPEWTPFPWQLELPGLPPHLEDELHHARNFSELMLGARLLYNLMLAEAAGREDIDSFRRSFSQWASTFATRMDDIVAWDLDDLWALLSSVRKTGVGMSTRRFTAAWKEMVCRSVDPTVIPADQAPCDLIRERERRLKKGWARLSNPRALELWGGASGATQLDYRWGYAHALISDIFSGLEEVGVA